MMMKRHQNLLVSVATISVEFGHSQNLPAGSSLPGIYAAVPEGGPGR